MGDPVFAEVPDASIQNWLTGIYTVFELARPTIMSCHRNVAHHLTLNSVLLLMHDMAIYGPTCFFFSGDGENHTDECL